MSRGSGSKELDNHTLLHMVNNKRWMKSWHPKLYKCTLQTKQNIKKVSDPEIPFCKQ